jgi:hypothetical protein
MVVLSLRPTPWIPEATTIGQMPTEIREIWKVPWLTILKPSVYAALIVHGSTPIEDSLAKIWEI